MSRELVNAPTWQALDGPVIVADCVDAMRAMPAASVDAIVCDPPYGISFMGQVWDGRAIAEAAARDRATRRSLGPESASRPGRAQPRSSSAFGNEAIIAGPARGGQDFQMWCEGWGVEALRVLKPGGHLLAFGGTRTYHRLAAGLEDAGFEIRDTLCWLYGSGFPKSLDVSKAIDKRRDDRAAVLAVTTALADAADAARITRQQIDAHMGTSDMAGWWTSRLLHRCACPTWEQWQRLCEFVALDDPAIDEEVWRLNGLKGTPGHERAVLGVRHTRTANALYGNGRGTSTVTLDTEAATDAAADWEGWGTALKPAYEPIVLARRPLVGTVAANVLAHGTGGLHIDACRIEAHDDQLAAKYASVQGTGPRSNSVYGVDDRDRDRDGAAPHAGGRWPANVVLDEGAAELLDEQAGESVSRAGKPRASAVSGDGWGMRATGAEYEDRGGPSRFFYTAKSGRAEREAGLREAGLRATLGDFPDDPGKSGSVNVRNIHPTVKPIELMRWLLRLVTPPGGLVLDPFCGSGTTGCAAALEGIAFVGIEREAEYAEIALARIAWWLAQPAGVSVDDALESARERSRVAETGQTSMLDELAGAA